MSALSKILISLVRSQRNVAITSDAHKYVSILKNMDLFRDFNDKELLIIANLVYEQEFEANELIIREGEESDALYFLLDGQVDILKKHPDNDKLYQINTIDAVDYFGEMALIKDSKRTATVRAHTPVLLLVLETKLFYEVAITSDSHKKILHYLNNKLYERIKHINEFSVKVLERELEQTKIRNTMGRFLIAVIALLCVYAFCMKVTNVLLAEVPATTLVSTSMLILFFIMALITTRLMPYPPAFYGLTLKNWRKSAFEGVLFTLPILALLLLVKWALVNYTNLLPSKDLFYLSNTVHPKTLTTNGHIYFWLGMATLYSVHSLIQEFTVRGVLQSAMQEFFNTRYRYLLAIIFSNVIFSTLHVFLSISFALFTFIPGLFWGWMYLRHKKTLVGTSISHILVGLWALFIVGF